MKSWVDRVNGILLIMMFLSTFFQVLTRNVFHVTAMWTEELAKFLFVFIVFLGSATLMEREEHIRISVLADRLPVVLVRWQKLLVQLVLAAFMAVFVWSAWLNVVNSWEFYAPSMPWFRMSYLYLVLLLSGVLTLWYILLNIIRTLFPGLFIARRVSPTG